MTTSTTLDAPAVAARFMLAVTASEQAEVLRLALGERDRTVQALQEAVHHLEQASIRRDEQHAAYSASASTLGHQVKTLEEEAARDAAERATKGDVRESHAELKNDIALVRKDMDVLRAEFKSDIALVRKDMDVLRTELKSDMDVLRTELKSDMDVLRTETKVGFAEMETRFAKVDAKVDVLRKDVETLENRLVVKLGGVVVVAIGAVVALLRVFPAG